MLEALERTPNSLGYFSISLLQIMQAQQVQVLSLDGVKPSTEAVAQGKYPWYLTLGLIHRRDAPPAIQSFVDFVFGSKGRQVLLEEYDGYAVER